MKVRIGNVVYDSETEPVMVVLSDVDKENIVNMKPECTKYASFPDWWTEEQAEEFMVLPGDEDLK